MIGGHVAPTPIHLTLVPLFWEPTPLAGAWEGGCRGGHCGESEVVLWVSKWESEGWVCVCMSEWEKEVWQSLRDLLVGINHLNRCWMEGGQKMGFQMPLLAGRERGEASHTYTLLQRRQVCPMRMTSPPKSERDGWLFANRGQLLVPAWASLVQKCGAWHFPPGFFFQQSQLLQLQSRTPKVRFFDSKRTACGNIWIFTASSLHCEKELIPHFFGFFLICLGGGQNLRSKKNYRVHAPLMWASKTGL